MTATIALPPVAEAAEENVIGACIMSSQAVEACSDILSGHEFWRPSHTAIYRACLSLVEKNEPVDVVTVLNAVRDDETSSRRVDELSVIGVTASNVAHYANIVREAWLRRELAEVSLETHRRAMEGAGSAEDLIAEADSRVMKLSEQVNRKRDSVFTAKELVERFRYRLANREDTDTGIPTPFPKLLRPLKGGRLYVLGGYQGDGKSALALQFIKSACEDGKRVGFASIEMDRDDLTDRLISTFGVPHHHVMDGNLSGYEDVVDDALGQINGFDFDVIDDEELDPSAIRRYQRQEKYDLLIVDHLHRIQIRDKRHEREEIGENVRRFTNIAREFKIPVLLLSQLSRGQKHDPFPRPTMSDVRGTSAIESEAALVFFVWRVRKDNERTNDAELIIAKNRFGSEGFLHLNFRAGYVRFDPTHQ
jgi:replicative DNA helicase